MTGVEEAAQVRLHGECTLHPGRGCGHGSVQRRMWLLELLEGLCHCGKALTCLGNLSVERSGAEVGVVSV